MSKFLDKLAEKAGLRSVELEMSSCGEVMIDGLPFSFSIVSKGKGSQMGLCVTVSGDDIDNGSVTFTGFEYNKLQNGKMKKQKMNLPLVTKKDGKKIYQARFEGMAIDEAPERINKKMDGQAFMEALGSEIRFSLMPHYSGSGTPEVMISVYPYENPLTGSATRWVNVTGDKDYFLHKLRSEKGGKKKRRR